MCNPILLNIITAVLSTGSYLYIQQLCILPNRIKSAA